MNKKMSLLMLIVIFSITLSLNLSTIPITNAQSTVNISTSSASPGEEVIAYGSGIRSDSTVYMSFDGAILWSESIGEETSFSIPWDVPSWAESAPDPGVEHSISINIVNLDTEDFVFSFFVITGSVEIPEPPVASFTFNPNIGTANQIISFDGTNSYDTDGGAITNYYWNLGDGTTKTGSIINHSYSSAGTFSVSLTVTDDEGQNNYISQLITILEPVSAPIANFTYSPQSPKVGDTVFFNAETSSDTDGNIIQYIWDFGDNSSGFEAEPTHTYVNAGTYDIQLTVIDNDELNSTYSKTITVTEVNPQAPVAKFTYSPEYPTVNTTITFDSSESIDADGTIENYNWNFGDGNTSNIQNPSHTYTQEGQYVVSLTITDDDGLTDTFTVNIADVAIPEFSSLTIILISLTIVAITVAAYKNKIKQN